MQSDHGPSIRLRKEQFRRHARLLGLETEAAQARHLGVHPGTIMRLLKNEIDPGNRLIALALLGFPTAKFEDLFEVVEDTAAATSAA